MEGCGYGGGEGGWSGRGLGWQNLAAVHHGGISTKIISPQATEGGGSVVSEGGDTERLVIVGVGGWGGFGRRRI